MSISAKQVADLRRQTGAGMMDCKKALVESGGDVAKATEYLQKKNLAAASKRSGRVAAEGAIGSYVHMGRIGVIVEVNSETDFVARNDDFKALVKDLAMHIAAANPSFVKADEIPQATVEKQKEIYLAQMTESGKPEHILGRIVEGKIKKWQSEICLLDQTYVKDTDKTVHQHIVAVSSGIKENIQVRRFVRFELGEGIEKAENDFASEVAAAVQG